MLQEGNTNHKIKQVIPISRENSVASVNEVKFIVTTQAWPTAGAIPRSTLKGYFQLISSPCSFAIFHEHTPQSGLMLISCDFL